MKSGKQFWAKRWRGFEYDCIPFADMFDVNTATSFCGSLRCKYVHIGCIAHARMTGWELRGTLRQEPVQQIKPITYGLILGSNKDQAGKLGIFSALGLKDRWACLVIMLNEQNFCMSGKSSCQQSVIKLKPGLTWKISRWTFQRQRTLCLISSGHSWQACCKQTNGVLGI